MNDTLVPFNWLGLLQLFALWLLVVFVALRALDLLFPRLRRDGGETPANRALATLRPPRATLAKAPSATPAAAARPSRLGRAHWQTNVRTMVAMLLDPQRRGWSYAVAGIAAAVAIAIGAETTPFVAAVCLTIALLWAWEGDKFAAAAKAFGLALAMAISILFVATVPPRLYSRSPATISRSVITAWRRSAAGCCCFRRSLPAA